MPSVAIIGLGLMGTSLGLALLSSGAAREVIGSDIAEDRITAARDRGAVSGTEHSAAEAASQADVVVLASPVASIVAIANEIGTRLRDGAAATDLAGTKLRIVRECEASLGRWFVGGHPMVGHEMAGPDHADAALFRGAPWILTPTASTSPEALATVETLVRGIGAVPVQMRPEDHDRVAGYLSHLPHAMAYALASSAREALEPDSCALAGGSFRSATRVARSDPEVWASILLDNAENVSHALEHFSVRLEAIRQAVVSGDEHAVVRLLALGHSTERPGA